MDAHTLRLYKRQAGPPESKIGFHFLIPSMLHSGRCDWYNGGCICIFVQYIGYLGPSARLLSGCMCHGSMFLRDFWRRYYLYHKPLRLLHDLYMLAGSKAAIGKPLARKPYLGVYNMGFIQQVSIIGDMMVIYLYDAGHLSSRAISFLSHKAGVLVIAQSCGMWPTRTGVTYG